jgi:hypothetical protein
VSSPSVPREDIAATPTETDLALAVREQLQALGIYARSLTPEERFAREQQKAVFKSIPERVQPSESEYLVAEGRVEDKSVRDVIRNALETGLIGAGQTKLEEVARALKESYAAYNESNPAGDKTPDELAKEYHDWLVANSTGKDSKIVLDYMKALNATLRKIELLGLTKQELDGSKAQIFGSVLRARLNIDPDFLQKLVEKSKSSESITDSKKKATPPPHQQASVTPIETKSGRAMY